MKKVPQLFWVRQTLTHASKAKHSTTNPFTLLCCKKVVKLYKKLQKNCTN